MTGLIGSKAIKPNPQLKPFEPLIGEWQTIGSHPYMPAIELHGSVIFEWIEGGAFILMRSHMDHPKIPDGIEIFGSDSVAQTYYMLHFDERGISRKYDVSVIHNQLKWWRDDPDFAQRFTLDIQKDQLKSYGEMLRNDGEWEQDLSLHYIKPLPRAI